MLNISIFFTHSLISRLLGLKPTYFKPLTRIRRLNLTDNGLTEVNSGAFRTNRQLGKGYRGNHEKDSGDVVSAVCVKRDR